VHTFTDTGLGETTLITPGDQMLNVMDTADNTITGSATITVSSTPPGPAPRHGAVTVAPVPVDVVWLPARSLHQVFGESEALAWDWLVGAVANLPADAFAPASWRPEGPC
jgi:hypothetical protein